MEKILFADYEKCTGCRLCEVACSFKHEDMFIPSKSRVQVMKWEEQGVDVPVICQHCEDAPCMLACPVNAISRDAKTGAVIVNADVCIGCRMCMGICPFGAITFDVDKAKVIKCDLCGGQPECVKFCSPKALDFISPADAAVRKKVSYAEKMLDSKKVKK